MKIRVQSPEFKAWHEVGHATVCLHLGGHVDAIEFIEGDPRRFAVTRGCYVTPDTERPVACGGFAAEFCLLQAGYVDCGHYNPQQISDLLFSNAWDDRVDFAQREVTEDNDLTKAENEEFMQYAIQIVAPILTPYLSRMQDVVSELLAARKIGGARVKALLRVGIPR